MTKKRKAESSLEVERNLHSSFVTAANSISQLFTQAIQQHKKAQVDGAQQALVRVGYSIYCRSMANYLLDVWRTLGWADSCEGAGASSSLARQGVWELSICSYECTACSPAARDSGEHFSICC